MIQDSMIKDKIGKPKSTLMGRWPVRLEVIQAISGLALVLFIWIHAFLVSSILISDAAMYQVARFFEGALFFNKPYPALVSGAALFIFLVVAVHALLAIRKIPASYREYSQFIKHIKRFKHQDTFLWLIQVITGLILMFLISVHLYQMFSQPDNIGPYASADRIWSDVHWPVYLILLFCAEIHGGIGLYRLALKWGLFGGKEQFSTRRRQLKIVIFSLVSFFLMLGMLTLGVDMKLGYEHAAKKGERYIPSQLESEKVR